MSERNERTNDAINDPSLLASICGEIAAGGTLVSFCNERELRYRVVNHWLFADGDRAKTYKLALDVREEHAKDLIIAELIAYMRANVVDAFVQISDPEGGATKLALKDPHDMPKELQRMIASVKFEEIFEMQGRGKDREKVHVGRMHEIKFYDKPRNIETFMKHLSMLVEKRDVKITASLADLLAGPASAAATGS